MFMKRRKPLKKRNKPQKMKGSKFVYELSSEESSEKSSGSWNGLVENTTMSVQVCKVNKRKRLPDSESFGKEESKTKTFKPLFTNSQGRSGFHSAQSLFLEQNKDEMSLVRSGRTSLKRTQIHKKRLKSGENELIVERKGIKTDVPLEYKALGMTEEMMSIVEIDP